MHYINQFFAGIGAEEKADVPVDFREGPIGPGKRLQELLGDSAEIVVTAYCGDDYFAEHTEEALASVLKIAKDNKVELVAAGPAFASGRYGHACVEVCHALSTSLDLYGVTALHPENPGVDGYKQYKDRKVFTFPTTEVVSGMEDALKKMAQCLSRLVSGSPMGTPAQEGYIPRGFRLDEIASQSGAVRAVNMLLDRLASRSFNTEIPVEHLEAIPVPSRVINLKDTYLGVVTTSGIIPPGNPDGFRGYQNTKWAKYPIDKLDSMLDANWDVLHGGYNTEFMKRNPNFGVPLDVLREMEKEGVFARLHSYYYVTPGARGLLSVMHRLGREMILDMKADGVDAVLLVST